MSKKKECKYPDCVNYHPEAKTYCTNGCSGDHYDYVRLGRGERKAS